MGKKDPVKNYENWLIEEKILLEPQVNDIKTKAKEYIERELQAAYNAAALHPNTTEEVNDVYAKRKRPGFL